MRRRLIMTAMLVTALATALAPLSAGANAGPRWLEATSALDTSDADPGDGHCRDADGDCSLRAAIDEANASGGAVIRLDGSTTYTLSMAGSSEDDNASGDLDVHTSIEIRGNGATIDAAGLDRAFQVSDQGRLTVDRVHVMGGAPPAGESGGAFASEGGLWITRSSANGNVVVGEGASGGAVFNDGGELHVRHSTLADNSAERAGGAIEANAGYTSIYASTMSGNETGPTPGNGGAFHLTGAGTVDVNRATVTNNVAAAEGGGLWNSASGTMTVRNSTIAGNSALGVDADQGGGGLFNDGGSLKVVSSTLTDNHATGSAGSGGGILNNLGTVVVAFSTVEAGTAMRAGGGIEANAGYTELYKVTLADNSTGPAPGNGGGLHLTGEGVVDVSRSTVRGNDAAAEGGGLWNSATGTMKVRSTDVSDNTAPVGPDLFNDGGTFLFDGKPVPVG